MSEFEVLPSAIEAICAKVKKAADVYCDEYIRQKPLPPTHAAFERAVRRYDSRRRAFNKAVQVALENGDGKLPDWAKETLAYQTERGFLDPLWKAEGWVNV